MIEAQDAKQTRENSPTPEIGLKCFLTQQSGAISSKKTLKDSTPLILVFIHVACASLLLGMRRHLQHEVAKLIQMLEDGSTERDVAAAFGVTQSVVSWSGTGTWQLVATSDVPAKDAYNARPLAKTATPAKWLYVAVTVPPPPRPPSTLPDGLPASLMTSNQ